MGHRYVLYDAEGFTLAMQRGPDGGWRFDAATLERLPAMQRITSQALQKNR